VLRVDEQRASVRGQRDAGDLVAADAGKQAPQFAGQGIRYQ